MFWFKNIKFAQEQQSFDFYNKKEYKQSLPPYQQQDKDFWQFVKTEANPNSNPKLAIDQVFEYYPTYIKPFLSAFRNIYNLKTVHFNTGASIDTIKFNNHIYVLDYDMQKYEEASEWLNGIYDHYLYQYITERDYNKEFWDDIGQGYILYHASPEENLDSIMKHGLRASDETRGLSNRGMGNAVFTSPNPDSLDSYGNLIIAIDVSKMKASGYMPEVSQEEPFKEKEMREALAHKIGLEEYYHEDYSSEGLYEDTVAFYGDIPKRFLTIHQGNSR